MSQPPDIRAEVNAPRQFSWENGVEVTEVRPGLARGVLRVGPNSINPGGHIHGGAIATLADTVGGCCACSTGGDCVTATSSMEYLRPALGDLFCQAVPKKLGRHLSVVQVTVTDTAGKAVATGTFTFYMTRPGREAVSPSPCADGAAPERAETGSHTDG